MVIAPDGDCAWRVSLLATLHVGVTYMPGSDARCRLDVVGFVTLGLKGWNTLRRPSEHFRCLRANRGNDPCC